MCCLLVYLFLFGQNSLTRSAPLNSDSQGRFGNRFLTSYDHRFVIKTVSSEDIAEMHNILKKYHQVETHLWGSVRTGHCAAVTGSLLLLSSSWSVMATRCCLSSWACTG